MPVSVLFRVVWPFWILTAFDEPRTQLGCIAHKDLTCVCSEGILALRETDQGSRTKEAERAHVACDQALAIRGVLAGETHTDAKYASLVEAVDLWSMISVPLTKHTLCISRRCAVEGLPDT
jgi:hypothetical protein